MRVRLIGKQSVYMEIAEEYKRFIRMGVLRDGEKLPSVRALALELGINPNTVERAYGLLEDEGFVRTVAKKGAFVIACGDERGELANEAKRQISMLKQSGLTYSELTAIAGAVYAEGK